MDIDASGGSFLLTSSLSQSGGYTVFAYVEPSNTSGRRALTGGSASTALEYDIYNGKQDYLTEYTADKGSGTATIPTTSFSLLDLAVNPRGPPSGSTARRTARCPGPPLASPSPALATMRAAAMILSG